VARNDHQTYVYVGLGGEGEYIGGGGLYRLDDDGGEWTSAAGGLPHEPQVRALLVHPDDPRIVYAGTQAGVYRSDDRGDHWEALESAADGTDVWSLAFHPGNPDVVYAGYHPFAIGRSEDGGSSWRRMGTERVAFPHITTQMPPFDKRVIGIAADPSDPDDVYAAIEVGGLLASRDGGDSWESMTDGPHIDIHTLDLHGVTISPAAPGTVYIITRIATFRSRDRGEHWEHVVMDELFPGGSYSRQLLVAPDDPRTMYLATGAGGGGSPKGTVEGGALYRTRDIGETWERIDLGATPPSRMYGVAVDRAEPSRMYCCAGRGELFASHDRGESWITSQVPGELSRSRHVYAVACG
jgi:photosystem II stability/assembly factor-like uncharacterized protein